MIATASHALVMVVDDDEDIRNTMQLVLESFGYRVVTAADGAEALRKLAAAETLPAVILLDLWMPVLNGEQFRAAQMNDPHLAAVPVVAMSGDTSVAAKARALHLLEALKKPIELDALLAVVARYCRRAA
jgi:CheY-like chemotaxis protein